MKDLFIILLSTSLLFSCEESPVKNTSFSLSIYNESNKEFLLDFGDRFVAQSISSCAINGTNSCSVTLIDTTYIDQAQSGYNQANFDTLISSLKVYTLDGENQPVFYGEYIEYSHQLDHWTYHQYDNDGYGNRWHQYTLRLK